MELLPITGKPSGTTGEIETRDVGFDRFRRLPKVDRLFLLVVVLPVVLAVVYFGFLASDVYVSESRFVIRSPSRPAATGLGMILQGVGFTNGSDEVYAAQSFSTSRDGLKAVNRGGAFERAYSAPSIFILDRFNPGGTGGSFESLYKYFRSKVLLQNDATTSITTLTIRAYTAQEARRVNQILLDMSEATVNRLNERGREDLVRYAEDEVAQAKSTATSTAVALAAYRSRAGVVDPEKQAEAQMQMVSKLQDSLISAKTELAQLQLYTPENPRIPVVKSQLATIQRQIDVEMGKVTGSRGSLAQEAVRYERLQLENELANKQLASALSSLEQAKTEASHKQAYVERIVEPNLPDSPIEPRRARGILATLALSLLAYGILRMLLAGVKEHAQ
jgi:capsular polysaccharide transport system permease protein